MRQRDAHDPRERRRVMLHNTKEPFRIRARGKALHFAFDRQRQYMFFPQRQSSQNNHGQRNNGARQQWPHENAALGKKSGDGLKNLEHLSVKLPVWEIYVVNVLLKALWRQCSSHIVRNLWELSIKN